MNFAAAEKCDDRIADLLESEAPPHDIGVVAGHLDCARIAEEIRRVQHVDVQRVALDPFAAIEEPSQLAKRSVDVDAERVLHRVDRAHLIGDRTDAADARRDIRRLAIHRGRAGRLRRIAAVRRY